MKLKAIISVILMLALIFVLCSCQLKKPESKSADDRLIGTLVTTESLDLFDMEAYLEENVEDIIDGKNNIVGIEDKENYSGRIYAERVTKTETTDEGETITHDEFVFKDIDGFYIFDAKIPATETAESYTVLCSEGGLSNIKSSVHRIDDTVSELELEADLYYSYSLWGTVFYMNPVYQESDGDIYVLEGYGHSVSGDKGAIDTSSNGSQSISDERTLTENEAVTTERSKVTINYIPVYVPKKIEFVFMNDQNEAIEEKSFSPSDVPEEIKVPTGTEYVILLQKSEEGSIADVTGKNCENAEYIAEDEGGICSLHSTVLLW